jgi:hypothetical protein
MAGFINWAVGQVLSAADIMKLPQHNYIVKSADESLANSGSMQDDNHLILSVAANTDYILEAGLVYSATNGVDLAFGWIAPSGATMYWSSGTASHYVASTPYVSFSAMIVSSIAVAIGFSSGGTSNPFFEIARPYGLLRVGSTAGTIRLRWAQNVSNAEHTVMRSGSWLRLTRMN